MMSESFRYFIGTILKSITDMLEGWQIGIGDISYFDFLIALATATIVIRALVNKVEAGQVAASYVSSANNYMARHERRREKMKKAARAGTGKKVK